MTSGLEGTGSVLVAHELSGPVACGIFPNQGTKLTSSALASKFFADEPPGERNDCVLNKEVQYALSRRLTKNSEMINYFFKSHKIKITLNR